MRKKRAAAVKVRLQHTGPFAELLNKVGYKALHKQQQNETGFLLPVPKQILYKTELEAAS